MNWSNIITALIAAGASVFGAYLTNAKRRRDDATADAVKEQEQNDRLKSIEKKLDIHNGYAEKLGGIQKSVSDLDKSVALIQKDIEYIKKGNPRS